MPRRRWRRLPMWSGNGAFTSGRSSVTKSKSSKNDHGHQYPDKYINKFLNKIVNILSFFCNLLGPTPLCMDMVFQNSYVLRFLLSQHIASVVAQALFTSVLVRNTLLHGRPGNRPARCMQFREVSSAHILKAHRPKPFFGRRSALLCGVCLPHS